MKAISLSAALLVALGVGNALAADMKLSLSGAEEVPAVQTSASGSGTISVGADNSVSGSITTKGIAGTMAHIHMAPAGKNGPVIIPLTKQGDDTWMVPTGAKLTAEQAEALKAGNLYVNVHSAANPGGEIRAQLK